jgi:hypothetical protein
MLADAGLYRQIFDDLSIPHVLAIMDGAGSLDWGALGAEEVIGKR